MENTEEIYTDFARVYDELMDNTPYEMWCERLNRLIAAYGVSKPERDAEGILDSERNLVVDLGSHLVKNSGVEVMLTDTEYAILEHLLKNRGSTVTAKDMNEAVRKEKFLSGSNNTVMVHVLNLRRKIEENPSNPKIIRTVWGKGYQID